MKEEKEKADKPTGASTSEGNKGIWNDERFAKFVNDPRFRNIHKSTKTTKIDKRFKSMFEDDKFKVKYSVDKYGRRVNKTSTDDLEKYYDLSSSDEDEEEKRKEEDQMLNEGGNVNEVHESDGEIADDIKAKLQDMTVDYARGEIPLLSDSSSDDESSGDENELFIEHVWGQLDNDAPRTEESTKRLACCNLDWDRIRASDILVLCSSFLPPGGSIISVKIYPSEYGKERMAEEEMKGPQELTANKLDIDSEYDSSDSEAEHDDEEGSEYHMEKLRQYQLNRLKYYYAVIECNSVAAADKLYAECDGLEYESTATKLDLRFIPDDMTFDDEPKDVCTEMPNLHKYKPRLFTTTALQQAKVFHWSTKNIWDLLNEQLSLFFIQVELTWDENDVDRVELNEKVNTGKLSEIPDSELRRFVAYSSEEDEEQMSDDLKNENSDENGDASGSDTGSKTPSHKKPRKKEDVISKYKNLLTDISKKEEEKKKNKIEMQFSWGVDTTAKPTKSEKNEKASIGDELTPFEKLLEKKREKKRARKAEIRQLKKKQNQSDDSESDDDLPDGIDLNDPYFAEEFANGEFAPIKTKKKSSKKASKHQDEDDEESESEAQKDLELLLDDDDDKAHFSLQKIQERENESKTSKKRRKKFKQNKNSEDKTAVEDNFQINVADNRFSAIYSSHMFNIDPTDSHYRKTKGMETLIHEKLKRKSGNTINEEQDAENGEPSGKKRKDVANSILIKSIKRKVQQKK